jgi:NADH-quinone oxidoreductase subunit E
MAQKQATATTPGNWNLNNLIGILQKIQMEEGYLSRAAMEKVASQLAISPSRVYGVATFYNQFRFRPPGRNSIVICRGTACHVKGSLKLADFLQSRLRLDEDGNSPDGFFTVSKVACIGACSIAPAAIINGTFYGHLDAAALEKIITELEASK